MSILISYTVQSQVISSWLPTVINRSDKFIFYLHGGVVTVLGDMGINQSMPQWGPYEYYNILDSLQSKGFNIISERRFESIPEADYVNKISRQIDTLINLKLNPRNIVVIGASAGWNISLRVAATVKNKHFRYVIMGGCWPNSFEEYLDLRLYGHFLSIIESSDPHGTCQKIFETHPYLKHVKEIKLQTGRSHGFINTGIRAWIDPIMQWIQ